MQYTWAYNDTVHVPNRRREDQSVLLSFADPSLLSVLISFAEPSLLERVRDCGASAEGPPLPCDGMWYTTIRT